MYMYIIVVDDCLILTPFYRYGGNIEYVGVKEYYGMPRRHKHILFTIYKCLSRHFP